MGIKLPGLYPYIILDNYGRYVFEIPLRIREFNLVWVKEVIFLILL